MLKTLDQLIVAACSLAAAVIIIVVADPNKATTLAGLITGPIAAFLSLLVGFVYTLIKGEIVKTEAKTELARAEAAKAQAQLRLSQQQTGKSYSTSGNYTYTTNDVVIVENEAKADIEDDGLKADKLILAMRNYARMSNYDLRPVAREVRIPIAKAFLENALAKLNEAWVYATKIEEIPTAEKAANKTTNMYYFKKKWEEYNGVHCGESIFDTMSSLLGYYNNVYSALEGIDSLVDVTVDYSVFGNERYTPTLLGWKAAGCVL